MTHGDSSLQAVLNQLAQHAEAADTERSWPAAWEALRRAGVLRWSIPPAYGGLGLGFTLRAALIIKRCLQRF